MAESEYCQECGRKHNSALWFGVGNYKYCSMANARMFAEWNALLEDEEEEEEKEEEEEETEEEEDEEEEKE